MSNITDIRFRANESLLVLQVRETEVRSGYGYNTTNWRDATVEDLLDVAPFVSSDMLREIKNKIDVLGYEVERVEREVNQRELEYPKTWVKP
jgi:hypothetical protein